MGRSRLTLHQQRIARDRQDRHLRRATGADAAAGGARRGRVIANFGRRAVVEDVDGRLHRCTIRRNLDPLACGDRVAWQAARGGAGVVIAIEPRRSVLARPVGDGGLRPVAANIDQLFVVVSPSPEPDPLLIDRYLVACRLSHLSAVLVANKVDLLDGTDRAPMDALIEVYRRIGYAVLPASAWEGRGLEPLAERMRGRTNVLVGASGTGKSSLVKALLPAQEVRIQAVSEATGLGTHTTTVTTLYPLPFGGDLVDSPGVRDFVPGEVALGDLEHGYREFEPYLGRCRFADCSHRVEPDCAVVRAADAGEIDPRRLQSYRALRGALDGQS